MEMIPERLRMAAQLVLHTLVANGVHSFQPRQLKRKGQLYTVHGVCSNGVEVPLLYAISSKKTEQVYTTIFGHMRDELGAAVPIHLRIVLDYEKAAINAVKRVFPHATVQGCAFHLAQAWNRRRDKLVLRRFIKGVEGVPKSLEAVVGYHQRETWYTGMYSGLWDKFGVEELRTTNLAESYHSQLNALFEVDHPTLDKLILVLRDFEVSTTTIMPVFRGWPSKTTAATWPEM
ncbi:hypothetical protein ANCCAN_18439 [Ancylostoma caninum]|uniref:MULE transposase domain-containing protein n=1 Tax=Ancylostoma caninum TaxID=29170 RepID=A0A368FXI1_ANCCA|nr:hypothetical protein ANCCAN_18439 [Ancylostoma caninum]